MTPWTVAHPASLSMGFPRQEYWTGLPFPSSGDLPNLGIKLTSPALAGGLFTVESPGKIAIPIRERKLLVCVSTRMIFKELEFLLLSTAFFKEFYPATCILSSLLTSWIPAKRTGMGTPAKDAFIVPFPLFP